MVSMMMKMTSIILLAFSIHTAAQEISLNGIVLNMYPNGLNKLATNFVLPPVPGLEIKLKSATFSNYDKTTSSGSFFFGKISDKIADIEITDPEYRIMEPPAPVKPVWSQNGLKYTMRLLVYKPESLKSTAYKFYDSCAIPISRNYHEKLYVIQVMYPRPLTQSKQKLSALKQHRLTLESKAQLYANVFAENDFSEIPDNYYCAYTSLLRGHFDFVETCLPDSYTISEKKNSYKYKKVFTTAMLMKAQVQEEKGSLDNATKDYELAIESDRKYYTIDYYSRFLLEQKKWQGARDLLQQKLELPKGEMSFDDSLFTWYQFLQLDTVNHFPLPSLPNKYAEQIFSQEKRILNFQDPYIGSILIATHYIAAYRDSIYNASNDSTNTVSRIEHLKSMIRLYNYFGERLIDTLGVWTPGKNQITFETGIAYNSKSGNPDSAILYFKQGLELTRAKVAKNPNTTSFYLDLKDQYRKIGFSTLLFTLKRRLFKSERRSIRRTDNIVPPLKKTMRKAAREIIRPNAIDDL